MANGGNAYDNNFKGALFANRKRRNDNDPSHQGQCEVNGVEYWISAWVNESTKDGSRYFSLRFKEKDAQHGNRQGNGGGGRSQGGGNRSQRTEPNREAEKPGNNNTDWGGDDIPF
jgi:hypothetical protein